MRDEFNMSATEVAPKPSQLHKRRNPAAILLACAGGLVLLGAFAETIVSPVITRQDAGDHSWGAQMYALLGMMLIAIVLSIIAFARPVQVDNSAAQVHVATSQLWLILIALILIHCSSAILFCNPGSMVKIDTFTFQRDACKSLLQGIDPYGTTQANIYDPYHTTLFYGPGIVVNGRVQVGFQYPPLTLLWALPGYLLGDVRYSYILAVIISALFSFAIYPSARGLWIVAVLLLSPFTLSVEKLCWTEPLVLMTLSATVYAAVKKRWWLPIALGLFLATKQYNFLALPLIGYFIHPFQWKAYWKLTGLSLAVGAATVLPFAIWNFRGLWHDLVLFHLAQPFRNDGVSFAVPFPLMMKIGPVLLVAFIAWAARGGRRNAAMFAAAYAVAMLLFVSTSKQAAANYYFLIGQAFFLAVAALPANPKISRAPGNAESQGAGTHVALS